MQLNWTAPLTRSADVKHLALAIPILGGILSTPQRPSLELEVLPDNLAICRLPANAPVPPWVAVADRFATISRTRDELSITAVQSAVPADARCERDYRALRVRGPLPLKLIGVLASIAGPLADAGISIFAISTFDTDYVLVKGTDLDKAVATLAHARDTTSLGSSLWAIPIREGSLLIGTVNHTA